MDRKSHQVSKNYPFLKHVTPSSQNLFLTGVSGCGKTVVFWRVSRATGMGDIGRSPGRLRVGLLAPVCATEAG